MHKHYLKSLEMVHSVSMQRRQCLLGDRAKGYPVENENVFPICDETCLLYTAENLYDMPLSSFSMRFSSVCSIPAV